MDAEMKRGWEPTHDPGLTGQGLPDSQERALVRSMIEESIGDARYSPEGKSERAKWSRDARAWIFGDPEPIGKRWRFGDFESACQALGLDPDAIRKTLARDIEREEMLRLQ